MKTITLYIMTALLALSIITAKAGDDWDKGWTLGYQMGRVCAQSGEPVPTEEALKEAAQQVSTHSNSVIDKHEFDAAFYRGFAQGYKDVTKPAF